MFFLVSGQETRYIVDTGDNRQFVQVNEVPTIVSENIPQVADKDVHKQAKEEENFWDRGKIKLLLTLCLENRFRNATKDKSLWKEISSIVGATPDECSKKYRNLRRTYIRLLKRKRLGNDIKWVHYNTCEEVFKECKSLPSSVLEPWEDGKVKRLLSLYIDNLSKFRGSDCLQKEIWKEIASALGTTEYNCYHKFKNLKRTYFKWMERSHQTGKLIKWPYQPYFERIFYNYHPASGTWDRTKTGQLIKAYSQIAHKFKNPRYQKKELWKEISSTVGETPSNCDRKFRNLKQTFLRLRMKTDSSSGRPGKWRYFKDFEEIYNHCPRTNSDNREAEQLLGSSRCDNYVQQLLTYYLENKDKFSDPLVKKKYVWKVIASKLKLTPEECDKKFRNLKQTYIRLREKLAAGKTITWPYFTLFEQIYNDSGGLTGACSNGDEIDQVTVLELKRVLRDMQEKKDLVKFERLVSVIEESNDIQRERNRILQALLNRK